MSSQLSALWKSGKISDVEYETYLLYVGNDVGARYLKNMVDSSFMEEPVDPTNTLFQWHDGRRSVWRDAKRMIANVERLLKGKNNGK